MRSSARKAAPLALVDLSTVFDVIRSVYTSYN